MKGSAGCAGSAGAIYDTKRYATYAPRIISGMNISRGLELRERGGRRVGEWEGGGGERKREKEEDRNKESVSMSFESRPKASFRPVAQLKSF